MVVASRHPVADAGFGEEVPRAFGVIAQLAPQPLHVGADTPPAAGVLQVPDPLQQIVEGHHPPGVDRQLGEQVELGGSQTDRTPGQTHPTFGVVDAQVSEREGAVGHGGGERGALAQGPPDPGHQLRG